MVAEILFYFGDPKFLSRLGQRSRALGTCYRKMDPRSHRNCLALPSSLQLTYPDPPFEPELTSRSLANCNPGVPPVSMNSSMNRWRSEERRVGAAGEMG